MDSQIYRNLLWKTLIALMICAALVSICYYYVDKPVAFYVYNHHLNQSPMMIKLAHKAEFFYYLLYFLAPVFLILYSILAAWNANTRLMRTILALSVAVIVTSFFKDALKICFGRYWPLTWKRNNPSLIHDNAYGFHPFHHGVAYQSFPSGHTAVTFAAMIVLWIAYPRLRWLCVLICAAMMFGLIVMDYHFVGDVVGGAFLGSILAVYAATLGGLNKKQGVFYGR